MVYGIKKPGCHLTVILQIYKSSATFKESPGDQTMSSIDAINQAPDGIKRASAASLLIGQKPNPWFNVLAGVGVGAGSIYPVIHLADDLAVVRDSRAYPFILLGSALLIALGFEFVNGFHVTANAVA